MDSNCIIVLKDGEVVRRRSPLPVRRRREPLPRHVGPGYRARSMRVRRGLISRSPRPERRRRRRRKARTPASPTSYHSLRAATSLFARLGRPARVSVAPPRVVISPPFPSRGKSHRSRDRTRIARVPHPPKTARSVDPPPSPRGKSAASDTPRANPCHLFPRARLLFGLAQLSVSRLAGAASASARSRARRASSAASAYSPTRIAATLLLAHLFQNLPGAPPRAPPRASPLDLSAQFLGSREGGVAVLRGDFEGVRLALAAASLSARDARVSSSAS